MPRSTTIVPQDSRPTLWVRARRVLTPCTISVPAHNIAGDAAIASLPVLLRRFIHALVEQDVLTALTLQSPEDSGSIGFHAQPANVLATSAEQLTRVVRVLEEVTGEKPPRDLVRAACDTQGIGQRNKPTAAQALIHRTHARWQFGLTALMR